MLVFRERDNYKAELDALQEDYSGLYDSFERARKIAEDQKLVGFPIFKWKWREKAANTTVVFRRPRTARDVS